MNRLREAREYVGFSLEDAARFLRMTAMEVIALEADSSTPSPATWERLSKLYRRKVGWLKGEPAPPIQIPADVAQLMEDRMLSDQDRSEVVRFVEWLQTTPLPSPATGGGL